MYSIWVFPNNSPVITLSTLHSQSATELKIQEFFANRMESSTQVFRHILTI